MNLGINESAVHELVDLFRQIAECSTFPKAENADISDLDEATQAAWEDIHGTDELTWSDIRSFEMRSVWEDVYASGEFNDIESALHFLIDKLSKALVKHFRGNPFESIGEDVISDMQNTIYARAIQGVSNQFFENVIAAYSQGAWPCGWRGEYPSGHLITYAQPA